MTTTDNPLVRTYITRLESALTTVASDERRQIIDSVEEHVAVALAGLTDPTDADVHNVLTRLGEPGAIAAEAQDRLGVTPSRRAGLATALLWVGVVVGLFDLVALSTSQVGPIEFVLLAVPVLVLVMLALGVPTPDAGTGLALVPVSDLQAR